MNCSHSEQLIQKGLDGRLSSEERRRLDAHLAQCAACRSAWDEYRRLSQTTAAWTQRAICPDDPGDLFTAQVMAQIADRKPSSRPLPLGLLWAGALFVLLAAASFWAGPQLPVPAPSISLAWNMPLPQWDWVQTLSSVTRDMADAWDALTAHANLPRWLWSALAVVLAVNGAFAWRALHPERETANR